MKADTSINLSALKAKLSEYDSQIADLTSKRDQVNAEIQERISKKSTAVQRVREVMIQYNIDIEDLQHIAGAQELISSAPKGFTEEAAAPKVAKKSTKKTAAKSTAKSASKKTATKKTTRAASKKVATIQSADPVSLHPAGIGNASENISTPTPSPATPESNAQSSPPENAPVQPSSNDETTPRAVIFEELPEPAPSAEDD